MLDGKFDNLAAMVAACVAECDTVQDAAAALLEAARADTEIHRELMAPYEKQAATAAVSGRIRHERQAVWTRPTAPDARVNALTAGLMRFRLPGGLPLAKATRADLEAAADSYAKAADDMAWKSRWLLKVAANVKKGKTVAQTYTEAKLRELQENTK